MQEGVKDGRKGKGEVPYNIRDMHYDSRYR